MTTTRVRRTKLPELTDSQLVVSVAEFDGERRIIIHVRRFDRLGMPNVDVTHSLSFDDARNLREKLTELLS